MFKIILNRNTYEKTLYELFNDYKYNQILDWLLIVSPQTEEEYRIISFYEKNGQHCFALIALTDHLIVHYSKDFSCLRDYIQELIECNYNVYFNFRGY